jgi:hypothetical protein
VRLGGRSRSAIVSTALVGGSVAAALAGAAPAAAAETTTFASTGAEQIYTVPPGITALDIVAVGGGAYGGGYNLPSYGARVSGTLAVTPGELLYVEVGGNGLGGSGAPGPGGFNGGAPGGAAAGGPAGGGGGGASDIRTVARAQAGSLQSRLLVAGGGGGGSGLFGGVYADGHGGNAGSQGGNGNATGGGPGTASAGGAGGASGSGGASGIAGSLGSGGAGGGASGGGGGGGYYGGGGGGGKGSGDGGGGGGGSSYVGPEVSGSAIAIDSTHTPLITISTVDPPVPPDPDPPADPNPPPAPSNQFTLGKPERKRHGRARVDAVLPGPGTITLEEANAGVSARIKPFSTTADAAGVTTLKIKPTRHTKRELVDHRVKVDFTVIYTPTGGEPSSQMGTVRLKR